MPIQKLSPQGVLVALLAVLGLCGPEPAGAQSEAQREGLTHRADDASPPPDLDAYLSWLQTGAEELGLPGAAVAIVSRDAVLQVRTWGVRNRETHDPMESDSLFRIASMSKTFAGTVATLLVENHLQDWDSPIKTVFPQIQLGNRDQADRITLRNIASHTTGLVPHAYSNLLDDGVVYDRIRQKFHEIPTVCQPGACYGYQNVVFSLIGDVVQASAHVSYEEFLRERLFAPLGMAGASTGLESFISNPHAAAPHRKVKEDWQVTTHNPAYYSVAPAAGVNATIEDMAIWARANLGAYPDVLPESVLHTTHDPVVETPYGNYFNRWEGLEHAYYGLGWRVFDYRGLRVIHHGGGVRGFRSEMALVPAHDLGIVVLFNAETTFANDVVPAFLDAVAP